MRRLFEELRHRRVFRSAGLYLVAAWAAVEVSSTVFPLLGVGDWAPRLVLAVVAGAFPAAMWWAWLFDLGPGGLRDSGGEAATRRVTWWQASLLGGVTIAGLAVPLFVFLNRDAGVRVAAVEAEPPTAGVATALDSERTVAVLPFQEDGAPEGQAYFSEGITDEIVMTLARFDGIRVLAQVAAARLLAAGRQPDEVGRDLGAGFILEGTIIRSGDQLRVRPKLTNTATFEVVWYAELERDLTVEGLLEVQRQVATAVARRLSAELIGDEQPVFAAAPPTRDLEAFDNYLRGNAALVRRTPASVAQAIASYRRATSLDSLFVSALAREAYASALFVDWDWAFPGVTPEELLADAQELAARALALDSTKAEAWLATAYTRLLANRTRPGESLPAFERALELRPDDAEALHQYGQTLMSMGRYGEALAAYHGALALDPTRAMTLVPMSAISLRRGDVDQARRWIDSAVVVGPDVPYAWAIRANLRNSLGDHEGARADAEQALAIDPSYGLPARGALAVAFNGLGDSERATVELERAMLEVADPDAPGQTDALFIGGALVSLGRTDEALDFIERARPRSAWLWFYLQHSDFDSVRDQPRFIAVEREANPNAPDG